MSATLCIDWGNTNVRSAVFVDNKIVKSVTTGSTDALPVISGLVTEFQPSHSVLCSVANHTEEADRLLTEKTGKFIRVTANTRTPVNNAYSTDALGPDRLAMVVAAYVLYPGFNNLVVCLGTCITYNFVQKTKTFRGGAISPGLRMRLQAMHEFTDMLPEVDVEGDLCLLGYDTDTCMRSGAVHGMAAEIDGMVAAYEAAYGDFNAILTGGDAPFFADKLKSKIFADPDLLVKGLNIISSYNASLFA